MGPQRPPAALFQLLPHKGSPKCENHWVDEVSPADSCGVFLLLGIRGGEGRRASLQLKPLLGTSSSLCHLCHSVKAVTPLCLGNANQPTSCVERACVCVCACVHVYVCMHAWPEKQTQASGPGHRDEVPERSLRCQGWEGD